MLHRPVVSLRLTNCYGPRLRIRDARQTFLGIWIRRVLEGEAFEVWGGEQLRDLTYVDDVTEAFLRAAEAAPRGEVAGRVFNLGGPPPVVSTEAPKNKLHQSPALTLVVLIGLALLLVQVTLRGEVKVG